MGEALDGVRVRERVAHRGIAGDRLGEEDPVPPWQRLEALLDPLVDVEQPKLKVQNRLARDTEPKVAGLDDARVDGTYGDLEHPLSRHRPEGMEFALDARHRSRAREILPERMHPLRPVVVECHAGRVRMALGRETEEVHHLALEPVRRGILRRDGRVGRLDGIDRRHDAKESREAGERPDVVKEEPLRRAALVAREQRRKPSFQ